MLSAANDRLSWVADLVSLNRLPALGATHHGVQAVATGSVVKSQRWLLASAEPAVAPLNQRQRHGIKVDPLFGQRVLDSPPIDGVPLSHQDAVLYQVRKTLRQDVTCK